MLLIQQEIWEQGMNILWHCRHILSSAAVTKHILDHSAGSKDGGKPQHWKTVHNMLWRAVSDLIKVKDGAVIH